MSSVQSENVSSLIGATDFSAARCADSFNKVREQNYLYHTDFFPLCMLFSRGLTSLLNYEKLKKTNAFFKKLPK